MLSIDSQDAVIHDWIAVCERYPVPRNLFQHQIDAMALLREGRHVLLGNIEFAN